MYIYIVPVPFIRANVLEGNRKPVPEGNTIQRLAYMAQVEDAPATGHHSHSHMPAQPQLGRGRCRQTLAGTGWQRSVKAKSPDSQPGQARAAQSQLEAAGAC